MNGKRTTATVLTAAALLAVPLAGCGKDKPKIPRSQARSLVTLFDTVKRQADAHACRTVEGTIESLLRRVEALPQRTDEDIRSSLRDGIENLRELVAGECTQVQKPKTDSTETTTSEPSTTSDTNTDTDTDTTTETTTETNPNTNPDTNTDTGTTPDTTPTTPSGGASAPGQPKKQGKGRAK